MSLIAFLLGKVVNYIIYLISSNVRFYLASVIAYIRYQLNLFSNTKIKNPLLQNKIHRGFGFRLITGLWMYAQAYSV